MNKSEEVKKLTKKICDSLDDLKENEDIHYFVQVATKLSEDEDTVDYNLSYSASGYPELIAMQIVDLAKEKDEFAVRLVQEIYRLSLKESLEALLHNLMSLMEFKEKEKLEN